VRGFGYVGLDPGVVWVFDHGVVLGRYGREFEKTRRARSTLAMICEHDPAGGLSLAFQYVLLMFMSSRRAIADTSLTCTHLRLVALAQWIAAGLDLVRGATTTGRGLVGGAVALWRLAQAVRLAILLARRLKDAQAASNSAAPRLSASCSVFTPIPAWSLEDAPLDDAALRRAMAELEAAISNAVGPAPHERARLWDRERPARIFARASQEARGPSRRTHGRRTPPCGQRPVRPPGPARPGRRSSRPARALETTSPPIATLAVGRLPLARA
jgi:hypothetical protein